MMRFNKLIRWIKILLWGAVVYSFGGVLFCLEHLHQAACWLAFNAFRPVWALVALTAIFRGHVKIACLSVLLTCSVRVYSKDLEVCRTFLSMLVSAGLIFILTHLAVDRFMDEDTRCEKYHEPGGWFCSKCVVDILLVFLSMCLWLVWTWFYFCR